MESSTTANTTNKKEKKGLSKAWKKLKDSFKSKQPSTTASSSAAGKSTTATTSAPKTEDKKPETGKATTDQPPQQSESDRRLEKAKAIFKKYDFEFSDADWQQSETRPKAQYERVQKPIRMRVKYTCHECKTVFGHDRICVKCQHKRCSECTRYPPKKKNKAPKTQPSSTPAPAATAS